MNSQEFLSIRLNLEKTQKEMAELLGLSLRSIQSFEQGWRKISHNVERQVLYVLTMKDIKQDSLKPCWELKNCPPEKKIFAPPGNFLSVICVGLSTERFARDKLTGIGVRK